MRSKILLLGIFLSTAVSCKFTPTKDLSVVSSEDSTNKEKIAKDIASFNLTQNTLISITLRAISQLAIK